MIPMLDPQGRRLVVVYNDRESEIRTPAQPLRTIPLLARDPFIVPQPSPMEWQGPSQIDMTRIAPGRPQAQGRAIEIRGRILDEEMRPVRHSLVEIWNCNAFGRYSHVDDHGGDDSPLDPNFYGFGRLMTDADGAYAVRTIRPAPYLARADIGWWRPAHVHFSILGGGPRLITQMYFPDDKLNRKDHIHMAIPQEERPRAVAQEEGGSLFRWDIVMRGRHQTAFEDE